MITWFLTKPNPKPNIKPKTDHLVLSAGEEYLRETNALLLRASIMKHNLIQTSSGAAVGAPPPQHGPHGHPARSVFGSMLQSVGGSLGHVFD